MFNLGLFELTLFGIIALIVLGPDKLPHAARTLGKWYGLIMHAKSRLQTDILNELQLMETQEEIKKELAKLRAAEADIKAQMRQLQGVVHQNRREILSLEHTLDSKDDNSTTQISTPMQGMFFLLGDYDKARRLPPPPRLPNTKADTLLHTQPSLHNTAN